MTENILSGTCAGQNLDEHNKCKLTTCTCDCHADQDLSYYPDEQELGRRREMRKARTMIARLCGEIRREAIAGLDEEIWKMVPHVAGFYDLWMEYYKAAISYLEDVKLTVMDVRYQNDDSAREAEKRLRQAGFYDVK